MDFKRRRLVTPTRYNRLPVPASDTDLSRVNELGYVRLVLKTESGMWGQPEKAEIRALHALEINQEVEGLIRTWHPVLRTYDQVFVSDPRYGPEVWLVPGTCTVTMVAGRAIHPMPSDRLDLCPLGIPLTPRSPWKEQFIFREGINPRKILAHEQLDGLRELFPAAVGVRVLAAGFMVMLFTSVSDIQDIYWNDWIMEVGGLKVMYDLLELDLTSKQMNSSMKVAEKPDAVCGSGCLGLRIKMQDGKEGITTVTHDFVRRPSWSRALPFADWISKRENSLRRLLNLSTPADTPVTGISRAWLSNCPIGKEVWLTTASSPTRIGTITQAFDTPSLIFPYPSGYQHDLCLITGDNLPPLSSPPGYPAVTEWAPYSNALAGSNVFVVKMNTLTGNRVLAEDTMNPDAVRDATVIGTQYMWDRAAHSQSASLLWTTSEPAAPATGWSGSVLCLGRPSDQSSGALVFQNHQVHCTSSVNPSTGEKLVSAVNAGFLLPECVRSSEIVTSIDQHRQRTADTPPSPNSRM
ncbi:hypothetical protein PDE_06447 [Penicillium oxalicum 114-2]|uniref:Uncharacterized protein n=1 Tax=Penicillium oxalicum (strain 114-2 / CGMCC 5302) TaxID=933388 RepID=S8B9M4_PENO1|nr:hypothetical protein PDE_06447 [Penicillium oxalicum 114-2]